MTQPSNDKSWPKLPRYDDWSDTCMTVRLWSQIVGKIRLTLYPRVNHFWGCTLYVTSRGLTTGPIPYGGATFTIDFDFIDHHVRISHSNGEKRLYSLKPMTVAEFYDWTMSALESVGVEVKIVARPNEVVEAIPFASDTKHASYDADAINRFWRALSTVEPIFARFRAEFIGKASPVHFFWGSFDLAATRFSGKTAPKHPGGAPNCPNSVMEEAYSHQCASAGFWSGEGFGEAAFYAYSYPSPDGFGEVAVEPAAAAWNPAMGEFILPYESVRTADAPEQALLAFLQTTYDGAATLGGWDRLALERQPHSS